jgi:cytochrome c oxidase subunit 2
MVMFVMMVGWHIYGKQNLSTETYKTTPEKFAAQAQAAVDKWTVRTELEQKIPVVAPPEGADVYMIARLWNFWPILELEKGKTYKLHLSSMDYNHGFSLQPTNINIQVVPGYEHVIKVTPNESGTFSVVCNEFCGIGHHEMVGRIYVK